VIRYSGDVPPQLVDQPQPIGGRDRDPLRAARPQVGDRGIELRLLGGRGQ
jgi:hypothetical protein